MDPNTALTEIRALIQAISFQTEYHTGQVDLDDAITLVEKFEGLDGWLSRGGFLPEDWNTR